MTPTHRASPVARTTLHDELVEFGHTLPDEPPVEVRRVLTSDGLILVVGPLPPDDAGERAAREFVKSITVMDDLGAAWAAAEAALPELWELEVSVGGHGRRDLYTATATYCYSLRHYRENVGPARSVPFEMAHAATPAVALRALRAALAPTEPVG